MARDLGTVGIGNHNPSFSVWLGGLGLSPGHLPFIMAGPVSLAWSLPVLWVFPRSFLPLTLFKSDRTSTKLVYSCRQTPTSLAATNTAAIWLKSVTTESLRTSAPCQKSANPPENKGKIFWLITQMVWLLNGGLTQPDCDGRGADATLGPCSHMWWLIRPVDWALSGATWCQLKILSVVCGLFHPHKSENTGLCRKWSTARAACWRRVFTIIGIIHCI